MSLIILLTQVWKIKIGSGFRLLISLRLLLHLLAKTCFTMWPAPKHLCKIGSNVRCSWWWRMCSWRDRTVQMENFNPNVCGEERLEGSHHHWMFPRIHFLFVCATMQCSTRGTTIRNLTKHLETLSLYACFIIRDGESQQQLPLHLVEEWIRLSSLPEYLSLWRQSVCW